MFLCNLTVLPWTDKTLDDGKYIIKIYKVISNKIAIN